MTWRMDKALVVLARFLFSTHDVGIVQPRKSDGKLVEQARERLADTRQ